MIEREDNIDETFRQMMQGIDLGTDTVAKIERARTSVPQSFNKFKIGDFAILTLIGEVTVQGAPIAAHLIAGKIVDAERGLIEVTNVGSNGAASEEMKRLVGKKVGFAYGIEVIDSSSNKTIKAAVQRKIAGNQEAAYYFADDMVDIGFGDLAPDPDSIRYTSLKFGKATVAGTALFDFITPEDRL